MQQSFFPRIWSSSRSLHSSLPIYSHDGNPGVQAQMVLLGYGFRFSRLYGLLLDSLIMVRGRVFLHESVFGVCAGWSVITAGMGNGWDGKRLCMFRKHRLAF